MEEKEVTVTEQSKQPLSREEILERSRKENAKADDERAQKLILKGTYIVTIISLVVMLIVVVTNLFVLNRKSSDIMFLTMLISGASTLLQGIVGKKGKVFNIIMGTVALVLSVIFLVMWILTLVA